MRNNFLHIRVKEKGFSYKFMPYSHVTAMHRLVLIALFAALLAVGGWISLPIGPVPITLQTMFLTLAGLVLGPRDGALAALLFLAAGLLGLPVFSGGKGGLAVFLGPTGGFLLAFPLAAWIFGFAGGGRPVPLLKAVLLCLAGSALVFAIGALRLMWLMDLSLNKALWAAVIPFLPGGALKLWAALAVYRYLLRRGLLPDQAA